MSNPSTILQGYTSYLSAAKTFDNGGNLYAVYYDKSLGAKQVTTMSMTAGGTLSWAINQPLTGTSGEDIDPAIVLDNAGGVYVAFTSLGTVYNPNTSVGKQDITIIKYNSGGVQQWIRQRAVDISMNTVENDLNPTLTFDTVNGALYVTYETTGATTPIGDKDVVMIKLTATGTKVWERVIGTVAEDTAAQVTADMCGNLVIVYNTKGSTETKTSTTGYDVAVAKYDTDGNLLWRRQNNTFNTTGDNLAPVITTDANGNIFGAYCVSGGTISGGSSTGGYDLVTFKLNAAGTLQWARQNTTTNTTANDLEPSITVDSNGYIYLAYTSRGAVAGKTNSGGTDIIVLKIDDRSGGNLVWSKQNTLNNTAADEFQPTIRLGSDRVFVGYLSDASGYTDFGILNIDDPTPSVTTIMSSGPAGQPTGLTAGATALSWTGPSGTVTSYNVYNVVGDVYVLTTTLPSSTTSVSYSSFSPSLVGQNWVVSAVNANGESMYSLPVSRQVTFSDVADTSVSVKTFITISVAAGVSAADIKTALRTNIAKFTSAYNAAVGVNVNSLLDAGATLNGKTSADLAAATLNILLVTNGSSVSLTPVANEQLLYVPTEAGDSFTVTADGVATTVVIDNAGVLSVGGTTISAGAMFTLGNSDYIYVANGGIVLYSLGLRPNAPTGVTATAGNAQAIVSWTAPAANGGTVITKYTIIPSDGLPVDVSANVTSKIITGLTNGIAYTFTVTATNIYGISSSSSVASSSVIPITVPDAPTGVTATAGNAQVTVSWTASAVNGGSDITKYTIIPSDGLPVDVSANVTSKIITGLTNGIAYTFTVTATNAAGVSLGGSSSYVTPITVPSAVTTFGASNITTSSVTLNWTEPGSNGGSTITKYIVSYGTSSVDVSGATSKVITGLSVGSEYIFSVVAVNAAGSSTVATHAVTTLKTVTGVSYDTHSVDSITYNLTSDFAIPTTNIAVTNVYTNSIVSASVSGTQLTVTGLAEYTAYKFYIDLTGFERFETPDNVRTKDVTNPGDVSGFTATPGNGQIVLNWTELAQDAGSDISGYYLYENTSGSTVFRTINPKTDTSETVTDLSNGTAYVYRIAAFDAAGNVGNTRTVSVIPRTTPSAPTITSVVAGNQQLTVSWEAGYNGGATVTAWKVVEGTNIYTVSSDQSSYTITNLVNGTIYTIEVYAVNEAGNGITSLSTGTPVTPTEYVNTLVSSLTDATNPLPIADFKAGLATLASQAGPAIILLPSTFDVETLTSTVAAGVDLVGKSVTVIVAATGDTVTLDTTEITQDVVLYIPTSVTLLIGSTSYDIVVSDSTLTVNGVSIALGGVFMLDHAYIRAFTGSAGILRVPDAPTNVMGMAGDASVSLTWTAPSDIGGATSVTYIITAKNNQSGSVVSDVSGITGTSYTYTGLTNGTSYIFEVAAVNDNGAGPVGTSSAITPVYVAPSLNPPGLPRNVRVTNVTSSGMRINWLAPNTGGTVTGYIVTNVTTDVSSTVTELYYDASGLVANTTYIFSVYATNADGNSGSVSVMQKTAVAPTPSPPPTGDIVPCFFANAPVLTPTGYQKISHLAVGELVVTGDGRHVPVQRVKITKVAAGPDTNPYVIERGQFGAVRRLLISPNHKVVTIDGAVEAKDLGLRQEEHNGTLTYYNLELSDYSRDTMVVAGVVVESLAPIRRMAVTMPQFVALMHQKYGTEVTPQMLANVQRTCRILADGRVEVPVLRR